MPRQATLRDIATATNLSITSVWKALADGPHISDQTKRRVRQASERLNYSPRPYRRSTGTTQTVNHGTPLRQIALAIFDDGSEVDSVMGALMLASNEMGLTIKLEAVVINDSDEAVEQQRLSQIGRRFDAVVLSGFVKRHLLQHAAAINLPAVILGNVFGKPDMSLNVGYQVTIDMAAMGRTAVHRLYELGHRRIGYTCCSTPINGWYERWLAGYRHAHAELGLPIDEALIQVIGLESPKSGCRAAVHKWRQLKNPPTGYVLPDAMWAVELAAYWHAWGNDLADDAIVVGAFSQVAKQVGAQRYGVIGTETKDLARACLHLLQLVTAGRALPGTQILVPFTCNWMHDTAPSKQPNHDTAPSKQPNIAITNPSL